MLAVEPGLWKKEVAECGKYLEQYRLTAAGRDVEPTEGGRELRIVRAEAGSAVVTLANESICGRVLLGQPAETDQCPRL